MQTEPVRATVEELDRHTGYGFQVYARIEEGKHAGRRMPMLGDKNIQVGDKVTCTYERSSNFGLWFFRKVGA